MPAQSQYSGSTAVQRSRAALCALYNVQCVPKVNQIEGAVQRSRAALWSLSLSCVTLPSHLLASPTLLQPTITNIIILTFSLDQAVWTSSTLLRHLAQFLRQEQVLKTFPEIYLYDNFCFKVFGLRDKGRSSKDSPLTMRLPPASIPAYLKSSYDLRPLPSNL